MLRLVVLRYQGGNGKGEEKENGLWQLLRHVGVGVKVGPSLAHSPLLSVEQAIPCSVSGSPLDARMSTLGFRTIFVCPSSEPSRDAKLA